MRWFLAVTEMAMTARERLAATISLRISHLARRGESPQGIRGEPDCASCFRGNLVRLRTILLRDHVRPIAVMGDPGSGKSSLILRLSDGRCNPIPKIGSKTDTTDWSRSLDLPLLVRSATEVFVDLPGLPTERHPMTDVLELFPFDLVGALLVVVKGKPRSSTAMLVAHARRLAGSGQPASSCRVSIVRTFVDELEGETDTREVADDLAAMSGNACPVFLVSNRSGYGIEALRRTLRQDCGSMCP